MNTDQQSRNQRNLTTKTRKREEILCDSSRFRVFVVNRMRALAGERTKILCKKQRIFGLVVQVNIDPCSSVVSFILLAAVLPRRDTEFPRLDLIETNNGYRDYCQGKCARGGSAERAGNPRVQTAGGTGARGDRRPHDFGSYRRGQGTRDSSSDPGRTRPRGSLRRQQQRCPESVSGASLSSASPRISGSSRGPFSEPGSRPLPRIVAAPGGFRRARRGVVAAVAGRAESAGGFGTGRLGPAAGPAAFSVVLPRIEDRGGLPAGVAPPASARRRLRGGRSGHGAGGVLAAWRNPRPVLAADGTSGAPGVFRRPARIPAYLRRGLAALRRIG